MSATTRTCERRTAHSGMAKTGAILGLVFSAVALAQNPSVQVDVSAFSRAAGTFEAYVDTRKLSAPYDVDRVGLLIRCRLVNGQLSMANVAFADTMLSRNAIYHRVFDLPPECIAWDRLLTAEVKLAAGKADGPGATVRLHDGVIRGATISLTPGLPAPQQSAPANGSVFNHFPRRTALLWLPVKGASSYTLEIQMGYSGIWSAWRNVPNLTVTRYEFDFVGAQPGRWRVWALRPDGSPGYPSPWWEFSFTQ